VATLTINTVDVLGQAVSLPVSITLCDINKNTVNGYSSYGVAVSSYGGTTNSSGLLQVDLVPNASIQPINSLYLVDIGGREFLVQKSTSTQTLYEALAATPADLTAGVVLQGATGPGGTLGYYGAFQDTTTQTIASTTVAYPITLNTTDEANGVSVTSSSRILFANAGTYNLQWSGQFKNTNNSDQDISIWLRKNGSDVAGSTGLVSVPSSHGGISGHTIAGWNFVFTVAAGDYYELIWSSSSTAVTLQSYTSGTSPTRPSTASVVLTVQQVMYTQDNSQPVPSSIPVGNSGQTLATSLTAITEGYAVIGTSFWTVPAGKTLQARLACIITGHTSGDIIGVDFYDAVSAASVISEGTLTTSSANPNRVQTGWINVPSTAWRGYARVRNSTAARGVARQCWFEFKYI
jgi:hypothetical protein